MKVDLLRREQLQLAIDNAARANQLVCFHAVRSLALTLTPLVNEYIDLCDQSTVAGQRELYEYIRNLCHANGLMLKCPNTGLEMLVFVPPRLSRETPDAPRIVFRNGGNRTHSDAQLRNIQLAPAGIFGSAEPRT